MNNTRWIVSVRVTWSLSDASGTIKNRTVHFPVQFEGILTFATLISKIVETIEGRVITAVLFQVLSGGLFVVL